MTEESILLSSQNPKKAKRKRTHPRGGIFSLCFKPSLEREPGDFQNRQIQTSKIRKIKMQIAFYNCPGVLVWSTSEELHCRSIPDILSVVGMKHSRVRP